MRVGLLAISVVGRATERSASDTDGWPRNISDSLLSAHVGLIIPYADPTRLTFRIVSPNWEIGSLPDVLVSYNMPSSRDSVPS
jgi:hypothetical protein